MRKLFFFLGCIFLVTGCREPQPAIRLAVSNETDKTTLTTDEFSLSLPKEGLSPQELIWITGQQTQANILRTYREELKQQEALARVDAAFWKAICVTALLCVTSVGLFALWLRER